MMKNFPAEFPFYATSALALVAIMLLVITFMQLARARRVMRGQREQIIRLETEAQMRQEVGESFREAARASVMTVGQELSNKLLEDHKREAKAMQQEVAASSEVQQQKFMQQFHSLTQSVAAIGEVSKQTQTKTQTLWRSLSEPAAAGIFSEVSLENLLRNLGLQAGQDFVLQGQITGDNGATYRPDAVIYLPHNRVMVIDCKASKFELELAAAREEEEKKAATERFRKAMHQHLDSLSRKNYTASVIEEMQRKLGGKSVLPQLINVMYLSTDVAVSRLDSIDKTFRDKMQKTGILAVGPSGLHGLCSIASMEIGEQKRDNNRAEILKEVEKILAGLSINLGHLEKTGQHFKRAAESLSKFTRSYNSTLSPRLRRIEQLGITAEGGRKLPGKLPSYEMHEVGQFLEGEEEEIVASAKPIPLPVE